MRSRLTAAAVSAAVAIAAAVVLGLLGWPQPGRTFEFSGLVVAAILAAALAIDRPWVDDLATMPPSFVVDFAALLLLGPHAAMIVVATGMVMPGLLQSASPQPTRRMMRPSKARGGATSRSRCSRSTASTRMCWPMAAAKRVRR